MRDFSGVTTERLRRALSVEMDYELSLLRNYEDSDAADRMRDRTMMRISAIRAELKRRSDA